MHKHKQFGFTAVEGLLLLVIAGIIGFTGWYVWNSKNKTDNSYNNSTQSSSDIPKYAAINTFADCKKSAGSKVQESFPEICVTTTGKKFTQSITSESQRYLTIKEWGIRLQLTDSDKIDYKITNTAASLQGTVKYLAYANLGLNSSVSIEKSCRDIGLSIYRLGVSPGDGWQVQKVGNYYYLITGGPGQCSNNVAAEAVRSRIVKELATVKITANN